MNLKSLKNTDVAGKTILYRSPYDIGLKEVDGKLVVKDESRIAVTIPTLKYLLDQNCKIVILTYVERPEGYDPALSTKPHAECLSKLLGMPVKHANDCVGPDVLGTISGLNPREILILENVRFHAEENADDDVFAKELAKNGEIVVFDAFPQAHRAQASTTGILRHLPSCVGFYFEKEFNALSHVLDNPSHPLTFIVGGVKAEDKIPVIDNFLAKGDHVLVGGRLPLDPLIEKYRGNSKVSIATLTESTKDIDESSRDAFAQTILESKMIIWAGPMGLFEEAESAQGTRTVAEAIAKATKENSAYSIVAGGDTEDAITTFGLNAQFTYISLAGGATLDFLAGIKFPVLKMLTES